MALLVDLIPFCEAFGMEFYKLAYVQGSSTLVQIIPVFFLGKQSN